MRATLSLAALSLALFATPAFAQMGPMGGGGMGRGGGMGGRGMPANPQDRPAAERIPGATIMVEPAGMAIAAWDMDGDGKTSRAELHAGLARSFAAIAGTAQTFGYIGYGDWAKTYLGDANALPSQFEVDANHDDRISLAELTSAFDTIFNRLDVNKDGMVTRTELMTIRAGRVGEGQITGSRAPRGKPRPDE